MVRPSKERQTIPLTIAQSDLAGDGTESGEDVDIDAGGTVSGGDGGVSSPPTTSILFVVEDSGTAVEVDVNVADWWDITLTADTSLTITNPPPVGVVGQLHIILRQGAGCPWTVTWDAAVVWPDSDGVAGGSAPTLHTVLTAVDVIVLTTEDGGTTWGGTYDSSAGSTGDINASDVDYDNADSGLTSVNVQDAIDELAEVLGFHVTSVGSITAGGSPGTIINDTTWNEFPGAIRLDVDRVLVVYRGNGTDHITDGQICGSILTLNAARDGIASVGTKFTILDDALDLRCEDGVSIVDGQIVVAFRKYTGTANTSPRIIICDDLPADFTDTSTWGAEITIPLTSGSVQNYTQGHVQRLDNGTYILPVGWQSAGTHSVGVARWTAALNDPSAASIVTIGSGAADYAEVAIEETSSGNLLALLRSVTNTDIRKATSTDSGATWSSVSTAYDGYGYPMFRLLLSGLILTVYRDAPNGDTAWRTSSDLGSTWSSETILDTTGTRSAYATLVQTTPNDIFCAYGVEYASDGSTGTADVFYQFFADSSTFGAGVAPVDVDYLVGTASATLTNEIVVGTTPGGELGGTWASPTVDATHSGSAHVPLGSAVPLAASSSGSAGSASSSSHEDHIHPTSSSGGGGEILISDTPAGSPLVFGDLLQNEDGTDLLYADT
jgi:hypothetical protein